MSLTLAGRREYSVIAVAEGKSREAGRLGDQWTMRTRRERAIARFPVESFCTRFQFLPLPSRKQGCPLVPRVCGSSIRLLSRTERNPPAPPRYRTPQQGASPKNLQQWHQCSLIQTEIGLELSGTKRSGHDNQQKVRPLFDELFQEGNEDVCCKGTFVDFVVDDRRIPR